MSFPLPTILTHTFMNGLLLSPDFLHQFGNLEMLKTRLLRNVFLGLIFLKRAQYDEEIGFSLMFWIVFIHNL